ncbi:MAG: four helix bundle protein [Nitrospirota bacterium]
MAFKFEELRVWQMALEYFDLIYEIAQNFPEEERFNLKSQICRAVTSISNNIAEGSIGQSDAEFSRYLGIALRSCLETINCLYLSKRRNYINEAIFMKAYQFGEDLFKGTQALRNTLRS